MKFIPRKKENSRQDMSDEEAMAVFKETQKLMRVCERIIAVLEEDAKRNRLGFQYGDKFVHY